MLRIEAPRPCRACLDSGSHRLVYAHGFARRFHRRSCPPFPSPSATASCSFKRSAPPKSSPFLLLPLTPRPCSPHCSPLPTTTPDIDEKSSLLLPQATGHRIAHAPPSSLSETALKPQLHVSPKRKPSFNPLSIEHHRMDQPLRPSPEATFTATTSTRTHRRSMTSEPVRSTTPPACRRWFLPARCSPPWSTPRR
jgi:hypothetical protein